MTSNWNTFVAQQCLAASALRKDVLPIKGSDTHMWLHTYAHIVMQQVADAVLLRAGEVKRFQITYLLRGPHFPSERPHLGLSCYR
jgi:hypothetical protein